MNSIVTLRVTVARDPDNEAEAWRPTPAEVAREVKAQMQYTDLDTGWWIVDVTS